MGKSKFADLRPGRHELSDSTPLTRLWRLHVRLFLPAAFGAAVTLTLTALRWRMSTRILVGWDSGVALYLALIFRIMAQASVAGIRQRAAIDDEGAVALLGLTTAAAIASKLALGIGTILLSWIFMHTIFALHYAREFYAEGRGDRIGGLVFPGHEDPDYWDFLYYSLVVAMTAQVSDAQITSKTIRRLTTVRGVISFFFNVAVLALTVNIVSTLM